MTKRPPLSEQDRADLYAREPFKVLLRQDGAELRQNGAHYICRLRDERTPSCHDWPPGVGRRGNMGWTWQDYGTRQGGDALGYLVDVRGLTYMDAAREMARLGGWWPASLETKPPDTTGTTINAQPISELPTAKPHHWARSLGPGRPSGCRGGISSPFDGPGAERLRGRGRVPSGGGFACCLVARQPASPPKARLKIDRSMRRD